jgi:signal transduction histidine kinase/CheY-like chemotaxis protein
MPRISHQHSLQFYDNERYLASAVASSLTRDGIGDDRLLIVATPAHNGAFAAELAKAGVDVQSLQAAGRVVFADARAMLDELIVDGLPDGRRFAERVGGLVRQLSGGKGATVRAYGEMVDVLWRDGNIEAAHRLEDLWGELCATMPLTVLCGYGLDALAGDVTGAQFLRICRKHDHIAPAEGYTRAGTEAARALEVSRLQQRARALEAEIEHRKELEAAMRDALQARAEAEEAARELADRLRDNDRRKDEFIATLAHELRNPLAPIRNAVPLIRSPLESEEVRRAAIDVVDRQVRQMARLVDDLMDLSRVSTGRLDLRLAAVDVRDAVDAALETSGPAIAAAGQKLTVSVAADPVLVDGDLTRLGQVVSNLLNNASKYTDRGGHIAVEVENDAENGEAVVAVSDTGIGMTPELIGRVFDMFEQANDALDRSRGGLGIGLTLARRLVELHGGRIEATSGGLGRGSRFMFRLPLNEHVPAGPGKARLSTCADTPMESTEMSGLRVVVVDDNVDSAEAMSLLVRHYGHDVQVAHDGEHALRVAESHRPHVVLLDIGLPRVDGYEVARRLRTLPWASAIAIVAVSGWGQDSDRQRSREAGFDRHLVKPADPDELLKLLADVQRSVADGRSTLN